MQVLSLALDSDTGVLSLSLSDGTTYQIINPGHARQVAASVSPGGWLSGVQLEWLQQFKLEQSRGRRDRLAALYRQVRKEIGGAAHG